MNRSWLVSLFPHRRGARRIHRPRFAAFESLEARTLLSTLIVDINDPSANDPGDNLYAEIHEAVAAASPGDVIKVHAGTYQPFTVSVNDLTIREASEDADPVIDATGSDTGIVINANGVTLRGLIVENADGSGFLVTGDANTLAENTARNNGLAADPFDFFAPVVAGFTFVGANNNTLRGNVAENNLGDGFRLWMDSDGNTLNGNTATGNGDAGIIVTAGASIFAATPDENSDNTTLINNTATGNGAGIVVSGGLRFNFLDGSFETFPALGTSLINNASSDNNSTGIVVSITEGVQVIGNRSINNLFDGIEISNGENANVKGNVAEGNGASGLFIPATHNSRFAGNTAQDNGDFFSGMGFDVRHANGNSFTGNRAHGNASAGFELASSNDNTLRGNAAEGNGEDGFVLAGSSNNTLKGNRAQSNERDGFRLEAVSQIRSILISPPPGLSFEFVLVGLTATENNTLQGNSASDNGGAGFHLIGALGNTLKSNTAGRNAGDGFRVERLDAFAPISPFAVNSGELLGSLDSDGNRFANNTAIGNGGWGYFIESLLDNEFDNNSCNGNTLGGSNLPGVC